MRHPIYGRGRERYGEITELYRYASRYVLHFSVQK